MPAPATTLPSPYPARVRLHRASSSSRPRRASPEGSPSPDTRASLSHSRASSLDLPPSVSEDESGSQYSPKPSPERPSLELFIPKANRASTMTMASAFHDVGTLPVTPGLGLDLLMSHFDSLIRERGIPTATNTTWRGPVLQESVPSVAPVPIELDTSHHRSDTEDPTATTHSVKVSNSNLEPNAFDIPRSIRRGSFASTIGPDANVSSLDWYLRQRDAATGDGYAASVARSSFMSVSSRYTVELGTMQAGPEMDELKEQFALLMRENRALARSSQEGLSSREEDDTIAVDVNSGVVEAREDPVSMQPRPANLLDPAPSSSASSSPSASPNPSALSLHNRPDSSSSSSSIHSAQVQPQPMPEIKVERKNSRTTPRPAPPAAKAAVPIRVTSVMRRPKPKARVLRITNPAGPLPLPSPVPSSTELLTPRSASASFYATSSATPRSTSPAPIAGPSSSPANHPPVEARSSSPRILPVPPTVSIQAAPRTAKPTSRTSRSGPRALPLPINSGPRLLPSPPRSTSSLPSERKTAKPSHSAPASVASVSTTFTASSMSYHPWESSQPAAFKSVPALTSANLDSSTEHERSASLSVPLVPNRWKDPSPETTEETRHSVMLGPLMKRWLSKRWHRLNRASSSLA